MVTDHDQQANRRGRLLIAAPGFIGPLGLLVLIVWYAVGAFAGYYTLRPAQWALGEDGPIGNGQLALFVSVAIAFSLLLLVPPLLAARPGRLRPWAAAAAVAIELLPLWASLNLIASRNGWGWIMLPLFAYVPAVVVARLIVQRQQPASRKPQATPLGP